VQVNAQLLVGILCGGLAGSVFTWYMNRPRPEIITYTVTTVSLGADVTIKNLVPNLKIQVGGEEVPVMHTHTVEFSVPQDSYIDSVEIALTFPTNVLLFGNVLAPKRLPLFMPFPVVSSSTV
jgi:hypothetical protein